MGGWLHKREERKPRRAYSVSGEVASLRGRPSGPVLMQFVDTGLEQGITVQATGRGHRMRVCGVGVRDPWGYLLSSALFP